MSLDHSTQIFIEAYNENNLSAAADALIGIRGLCNKSAEPYPSDLSAMFCMKLFENIDQEKLLKREYPGKYFKNTVTGEYEIHPHNPPVDANRAFGRLLIDIKNKGTLTDETANETSVNVSWTCGEFIHPDIPENDIKAYIIYAFSVIGPAQSVGCSVKNMPLANETFPESGWLPFDKEVLSNILEPDIEPVKDSSGNIVFFMKAFQSLASRIQQVQNRIHSR